MASASQVILQGVEGRAEVAVEDDVEHGGGYVHAMFVHLRPERVLRVIVDAGPEGVFACEHHQAAHLVEACHHVAMELVSGAEPLLDGLHGWTVLEGLALAIEVPGAEAFGVLVARLHHGCRVGIFG